MELDITFGYVSLGVAWGRPVPPILSTYTDRDRQFSTLSIKLYIPYSVLILSQDQSVLYDACNFRVIIPLTRLFREVASRPGNLVVAPPAR